MIARTKLYLERALEGITALLLAALAVLVVVAVLLRTAGSPLVWYDEAASVLMAWLTFYGASLAAIKKAHIGFPRLIDGFPRVGRIVAVVLGEAVVICFLLLVAWAGTQVMSVLEGEALVTLPWISTWVTHSVIPLSSLAFVLAELLTLPERLSRTASTMARLPES